MKEENNINKPGDLIDVPFSEIDFENSRMPRARLDERTVKEYVEAIEAGAEFPPVVLVRDGDRYWIVDGWHRIAALKKMERETVPATVENGDRPTAIKGALSANQTHGLRRSNADKRQCVKIALEEFPEYSSRRIAEMCAVDHKTVEKHRSKDVGKVPASEKKRTDAMGRKQPSGKSTATKSTKSSDPDEPEGGSSIPPESSDDGDPDGGVRPSAGGTQPDEDPDSPELSRVEQAFKEVCATIERCEERLGIRGERRVLYTRLSEYIAERRKPYMGDGSDRRVSSRVKEMTKETEREQQEKAERDRQEQDKREEQQEKKREQRQAA